jgi:hypothetical protein
VLEIEHGILAQLRFGDCRQAFDTDQLSELARIIRRIEQRRQSRSGRRIQRDHVVEHALLEAGAIAEEPRQCVAQDGKIGGRTDVADVGEASILELICVFGAPAARRLIFFCC